jgi:hypothetical protein
MPGGDAALAALVVPVTGQHVAVSIRYGTAQRSRRPRPPAQGRYEHRSAGTPTQARRDHAATGMVWPSVRTAASDLMVG